jgi:hypothetical protein
VAIIKKTSNIGKHPRHSEKEKSLSQETLNIKE